MKLNLGCGNNKAPGFINVDAAPECEPDLVFDLETFPWPWPDSSAEEVMFLHSLEHLGADVRVFLRLMQELYRVCAPDAVVTIHVPHPRHDNFLNDPTHVRAITPKMLELFDRELNDKWRGMKVSNTPLALYTGVDFRIKRYGMVVTEPYASQAQRGELSDEELKRMLRTLNNVAEEYRIELVVRK